MQIYTLGGKLNAKMMFWEQKKTVKKKMRKNYKTYKAEHIYLSFIIFNVNLRITIM